MLSQHMLICLGMCFHCTCFWSLKSTVVVKCSHRDLQRSKSCFSYTVHSLNADTMSNISVSHKIPTLYLLGENICWMLFEYLFLLQVKTSDSCHVQLKHNPPKSPNYNSELRPTLSTILQGHICTYLSDINTWILLKHFKLYITKTQLTFFSFRPVYFLLQWKNTILDSRICLQVSTGPSAIALVYFPYSSPWLTSLLPLSSDWNNFSSNSNAFFAWCHFKHCQSHLLKHSAGFIPAFDNLHWLPSGLA